MPSEIIIKKNLIIFRNPDDWSAIYANILRDFGMGMLIHSRMRNELGFTSRTHRGLGKHTNLEMVNNIAVMVESRHYEQQVHLDFFDDKAQSWFQLKYLNL